MNNTLILFFGDDTLITQSLPSLRQYCSTYIFGVNSLTLASRQAVGVLTDSLNENGKQTFILESSKPEKSGWFANQLFTLAMNKTESGFISFVDKLSTNQEIENQIKILQEFPQSLAAGRQPDILPDYFDFVYPIAKEEKESKQINDIAKSTFTLTSPWTLNLGLFRQIVRNQTAFNLIADGMNRAFQDNVQFEYFFTSLYVAHRKIANCPILLSV